MSMTLQICNKSIKVLEDRRRRLFLNRSHSADGRGKVECGARLEVKLVTHNCFYSHFKCSRDYCLVVGHREVPERDPVILLFLLK